MTRLLFTIMAMVLLAWQAPAREPDEPLWILVNAQTLSGERLANLEFHLIQDGRILGEMKTNQGGFVRFMVPDSTNWETASLVHVDPAWQALPVTRRLNRAGTTWTYLYRFYPTDPTLLTHEDRDEYLLALPEIIRARRVSAGPLDPKPMRVTQEHLSAFLEGSRVEQPARFAPETTPTLTIQNTPIMSSVYTNVVDVTGNPLRFRRVLLFSIIEGSSDVLIADTAQTDTNGAVGFAGLEPGHLYRMEVPVLFDGMLGRSVIFRAPASGIGRRAPLAPIVVGPSERRLSGVVTYNGEPIAGAEIMVDGPVRLSTRSDQMGNFELLPIPPQAEIVVSVRRPGAPHPVRLPITPGRLEWIIPLELFSSPQTP